MQPTVVEVSDVVNASLSPNGVHMLAVERLRHDLHHEDEDVVDYWGHEIVVEKNGSEMERSGLRNFQKEELLGDSLAWPAYDDLAPSFAFDARGPVQAASYLKDLEISTY